ncbi:MAG TPA: hypothetical protein DDY13_08725 [Cytophagales bacterium]|jgi:hypothetical protein|nr:hypothetical protein [Cytophagales bacterium]
MIKFFRQIRYALINQNQSVNYLKYAIGEIVLVVIGILIALQINNWNEHRKEQNLQHKLVLQLLEDAVADSTFYASREALFLGQMESYQQMRRLCAEGLQLPQDSVLLPRQNVPFTMAANQSAIISNAKEYTTITDEQIKKELRDYTLSYSFVKKAIEIHGDEVRSELHNLVKQYNIGIFQGANTSLQDFEEFCQDPYIQGILRNVLGATQNALNQTQRFLSDHSSLITSCRVYLENNP